MTAKRLAWLVLACLVWSGVRVEAAQVRRDPARDVREAPPQIQSRKDPARDIMLQAIGMLAGQGLVLGHESLDGVFVRFENKLLARDKAEQFLADAARYADLVLGTFKSRLMGQLADQERKDLTLLMGFYEAERQAIEALAAYVRSGGGKNRETFEKNQERVAAIIRQISLGPAAP
jgi:hypothetical protein